MSFLTSAQLKTDPAHTEHRAKQISREPSRWFFSLEDDIQSVDPFTEKLVQQCAQEISPAAVRSLRLAIRELLFNAIEHGNLRISFAEKAEALRSDSYYDLLAEREKNLFDKEKPIHVKVERDSHQISVQIQDEGEGFDWKDLLDPSAPENLLSENGRGIYLAWACVDSLEFNTKGNIVTIVKYLSPILL
ncbi:MAG: ATP-binding protein [Deltaproteobacteria bacterium]|nr:ATP-binding protein [Deltaproteobacteria bacterium]